MKEKWKLLMFEWLKKKSFSIEKEENNGDISCLNAYHAVLLLAVLVLNVT